MSQAKKEEFYALYEEYKVLRASLTPEEYKALEFDKDGEDEKFKKQFFIGKSEGEEDDLKRAEQAVEHVKGMIQGIKDDLKAYHEKQEMIAGGLTPIKILARYLKLSGPWKKYVLSSIEFGYVKYDEKKADEKIAEYFGELAAKFEGAETGLFGAKEELKDDERAFLVKFSNVLKEVEANL